MHQTLANRRIGGQTDGQRSIEKLRVAWRVPGLLGIEIAKAHIPEWELALGAITYEQFRDVLMPRVLLDLGY